MHYHQLVYAPNPIFKQKASLVDVVDDTIRASLDKMLNTMYIEHGVGIGANMVGLLQQLVVIDLQEDGKKQPLFMVNPTISWASDNMQTFTEASLSFPGISAPITRPAEIEVSYLDYEGKPSSLKATGFLATVIQHEIDYLHGKTYLDYLSHTKRSMLLKKMQKHIKAHPPHIHGAHCHH